MDVWGYPVDHGDLASWMAMTCVFLDIILIVAVPFCIWVRQHGSVAPLTAVLVAIVVGVLADLARAVAFDDAVGGIARHLRDLQQHPIHAAGILPFCIVAVPIVLFANRKIPVMFGVPEPITPSR